MIVDKFVGSEHFKQDVIGLDIASLANDRGRTPVVATAEAEQIVLHWYSAVPIGDTPAGWRQHRITHQPYEVEEWYGDIERVHSLPWSQRIGIVSAEKHLILFFKRRINDLTTLYLSRFAWDGSLEILTSIDAEPLPVPIDLFRYVGVGYSLWAGFDEIAQSAVVLIQSFRRRGDLPRLTILRSALDDIIGDPTKVTAWQADDIDLGGYDLDARVQGGRLTYLHREQPYGLTVMDDSIRFDGSMNIVHFPTAGESVANPSLSVRTLDLSIMDFALRLDNVPGGLHPQLQCADPLYITCDAIVGGEIRLGPDLADQEFVPVARFGRLIGDKRLFRYLDDAWFGVTLMPLDFTVHPRLVRHESGQIVLAGGDGGIRATLLQPTLPVQLAHFVQDIEKGIEYLDFVQHHVEFASLIQMRAVVRADASGLDLLAQTYQVLDINHEQITEPHALEAPAWENDQFRRYRTGVYNLPPELGSEWTDFSNAYVLDNTLGGLVSLDPANPSLTYIAYTDLGDGGVRVICHDGPPPGEPTTPWLSKSMPPGSVIGSGAASDTWIELSHGDNAWLAADLPGNLSPGMLPDGSVYAGEWTVGSAFERLVDTVFRLFSAPGNGFEFYVDSIMLDPEGAAFFDGFNMVEEPLWDVIWSPLASIPDNSFFMVFGAEVELAKYRIGYRYAESGEGTPVPSFVTITNTTRHNSAMRFTSRAKGPGRIEYRSRVRFSITETRMVPWLEPLFTVGGAEIILFQQRFFSPAILMSDRHEVDLLTNGRRESPEETTQRIPEEDTDLLLFAPAALSARPVSDTKTVLDSVQIPIEMSTLSLAVIGLLFSALILLGLILLVSIIAPIVIPIVVAGAPIVAVIWLALAAGIAAIVTPAVRAAVESAVAASIVAKIDQINDGLNDINLMGYAGEGLGEAIARMVLRHPDVDLPLDEVDPGLEARNRFKSQFWQTIYVTDRVCRVLIRKQLPF